MEKRTNGAKVNAIKPSVSVDYIYSRNLRLEADLSYDMTKRRGDTLPTNEQGTNLGMGLIYDF